MPTATADKPAARADPGKLAAHVDARCYVVQHDHRWQPGRWPRCSARFWCARCRVWFDGGRCFPSRPY